MNTYQDIEINIKKLINQSKDLYMMNREQIFIFITTILAVCDELANFMHDIDSKMLDTEKIVCSDPDNASLSSAALSKKVKKENARLISDREWAKSQLSLLNGLRIAALSAQRSAE